jgi:hypothetical protein
MLGVTPVEVGDTEIVERLDAREEHEDDAGDRAINGHEVELGPPSRREAVILRPR